MDQQVNDALRQEFELLINGQRVAAASRFDVLNPADESVVAQCPQGSVALADLAVASAQAALPGWSAVPEAERAAKLHAIADLVSANSAALSRLLTLEQGKPQDGPGANMEVQAAQGWLRATAAMSLPVQVIQDDAQAYIAVERRPVGVVASITPWNWPLMIAVWHLAPAILAGCTAVIKPSPFTPLSTLRLVELMNAVLPPGVVNVVTGDAEVGNHLSAHPGVAKIVFTGSTDTGKRVMVAAAGTLKRLTLELGGNDAGIVLPGTNVAPLLEKLFWGCFINAGQTCAALKRLYVHENQYEEVVAKFAEFAASIPVGNGMEAGNLIGPLTNRMQQDKVAGYVDEARALGARVVIGGHRPEGPGYFYPLTVVADVTDDMGLVREEQFGPVIPIIKYSTLDEAIARANALEAGLAGSIWGDDPREAARHAARLQCGTVWVNQHGQVDPRVPFGGVKQSGIGVEFGVDGLREYTTAQAINIAR
ncbi:aldehyde dehydrogenase family protein (plasmid) [Massilia varians]